MVVAEYCYEVRLLSLFSIYQGCNEQSDRLFWPLEQSVLGGKVMFCTCVYMYVCVCELCFAHVYICMCVCVCELCFAHVYICMCVCVCVCVCVSYVLHMCIYVCVCVCVCVCVWVMFCTCVYMYVCVCVWVMFCTVLPRKLYNILLSPKEYRDGFKFFIFPLANNTSNLLYCI